MGRGNRRNSRSQKTEPTGDADSMPDVDGALLRLRRNSSAKSLETLRSSLRREITLTLRGVEAEFLKQPWSRTAVRALLHKARDTLKRSDEVNDNIVDFDADEKEFDKQFAIQLNYMTEVETLEQKFNQLLDDRENDPPSSAGSVIDHQELLRAADRQAAVAAAEARRQALEDARDRAAAARQAFEEAEEEFRKLQPYTELVKQLPTTNAGDKVLQFLEDDDHAGPSRSRPIKSTPCDPLEGNPDDWIDRYVDGLEQQAPRRDGHRGAIKVELSTFSGRFLDWFNWIDLFRALIHDTSLLPGEKLALLRTHLPDRTRRAIESLGGGEAAYQEALASIKRQFGRRAVLRQAYTQELEKLNCDPSNFAEFAERVRTCLFNLNRIGGSSSADLIEKICFKLPDRERLAWNEKREGDFETRSLIEFGRWLCRRAEQYENTFALVAEQSKGAYPRSSSHKDYGHRARSHHSRTRNESGGSSDREPIHRERSGCFMCGGNHQLMDCPEFKAASIPDRVRFAMKRRLCFVCFGSRHSSRDCRSDKRCGISGCRLDHHVLLHDSSTEERVKEVRFNAAQATRKNVALGVIRVPVFDVNNKPLLGNFLFDGGSDSTFVRERYATQQLMVSGPQQRLNITGVGGMTTSCDSQEVSFRVQLIDGSIETITANTKDQVAGPMPHVDWPSIKNKWNYLSDLDLQPSGGHVDVLLGCDYAHLIAALEVRRGGRNEPYADLTLLGWVVRGVIGQDVAVNSARVHVCLRDAEKLDQAIRLFCETESFGTELNLEAQPVHHQQAITIVEEGLEKNDSGWTAPLTWKTGEPVLEYNYTVAAYRLHSLLRRFEKDKQLEQDYRAAMETYFTEGYAVRLTDKEARQSKYLLPHQPVFKKVWKGAWTKKLRIVFDAASRFRQKSLNDCLLSGPALQNILPTVFIRLRENEVAFAADIKAMYSRIRMREEDAQYHRFLWVEAGSSKIITCQMNRLTFGDCCSPFIAISAVRRTADEAGPTYAEAAVAIKENLYMDDYLDSTTDVTSAIRRATMVRDVLATGDFHLEGWVSNSSEFLSALQPGAGGEQQYNPNHEVGTKEDAEAKLLGVLWRPATDVLTFCVHLGEDVKFTRIGLMSKVAQVYDPMGMASPLTVKAKIKQREHAVRGLSYTDDIPDEDQQWWREWFASVESLNEMKTPRCLFPNRSNIVLSELHTLVDASEEAFAAATYIRNVYDDGSIKVQLVMGRTKLAQLKTLSIPRLELNAALLGARLGKFVFESFSIEVKKLISRRFYWIDSSSVRNWVRSTASYYKPYISTRLGEIQTLTKPIEWRFVPGKLNCSDAATRSCFTGGPAVPPSWLYGSEFLGKTEVQWPQDLPWMAVTEEVKSARTFHALQQTTFDWDAVQLTPESLTNLIHLTGEWKSLLRRCQLEEFPDEIDRLKRGKPVRKTSKLLAFTPELDEDDLLRIRGRIHEVNLPFDNRHPVLLPAKHPLVEKIILVYHQDLHHAGTDFLLARIRQHFWILNGRERVKKARQECRSCKKEKARPATQIMADLPAVRLDYGSPSFTRTAVDFFGPLEIETSRGRTAKRYGALFTCLVTRAVYVDLATSLSTDDFLLVLRRFISIYNGPKSLHSDNGTNFVGAERELVREAEKMRNSTGTETFLNRNNFTWIFQPPSAPHFGGAHESLVKSTKRALYRLLEVEVKGERRPTEQVLQTLLFEVSGILNSRPLTYVSSDPADYRPITPNDFMCRPPSNHVPKGSFDDALPGERYRYVQRLTQLFWDLWKGPFLQSLISRKKWKMGERNFSVNDVVMVKDPNARRSEWKIGKITEVYPNLKDGFVRVVKLELDGKLYVKPIHLLCLLEPWSTASSATVKAVSGEDVPASPAI